MKLKPGDKVMVQRFPWEPHVEATVVRDQVDVKRNEVRVLVSTVQIVSRNRVKLVVKARNP
jgi:hypothetical protein